MSILLRVIVKCIIIFPQSSNELLGLDYALLFSHRHDGIKEFRETVEQMLLLQDTLRCIFVVDAAYEVCSVVATASIDTGHTVPVGVAIRLVQAIRRVAGVGGIVVIRDITAVYVVKVLAAAYALVVGQLVLDDLVAEGFAEVKRLQHGIYIASIAKIY